jgi:Co/Zn/Cd efflux system component
MMGGIGLLALAANLAVAGLLYRYRVADSQAMSVWLCTRNDCIVNIAVMAAGASVWLSGTPWPDVAVAAIIAYLGLSAALRVIRLARSEFARADGCPPGSRQSEGRSISCVVAAAPRVCQRRMSVFLEK